MKIGGTNRYSQLCAKPNNKNIDGTPIISPPIDSKLDLIQLLSFSLYNEHAIWVTRDGKAFAIGDNRYNQILENFPKKILEDYTRIHIQDQAGQNWKTLSAVCGEMYTLYLVSLPNDHNFTKLVYSYKNFKDDYPLFLSTGDRHPIALFGGSHVSAAVDSEGLIVIITNSVIQYKTSKIEWIPLPRCEKAVNVACCDDFVLALSLDGRVYECPLNDDGKFSFSEVSDFDGYKIAHISGTHNHCFAVSNEGLVFGRGSNKQGRLCIDNQTEKVEKFTLLKSLKKYKISSAFAGYSHSLFLTLNGMVFACGDNYNGNLLLKSGPSEDDIFTPTVTSVTSGASSCIAGWNLSVIFVDCDAPPNSPNQRITNLKNNLTFFDGKSEQTETHETHEKSSKSDDIDKHEKKRIKELENTVAIQQARIKELELQILKMKQRNNSNQSDDDSADSENCIKIYDAETISNLRTIREISKNEGKKVYEVAKEESYALKVMKIKNWNDEIQQKLIEQLEILRTVNHPNFLKIYGIYENEGSLSALLEYCQMNLHQAIKRNALSKVQIVCAIYQIAEGMKCSHFLGITHCNLKPSNIMIGSNGLIKICDFGASILKNCDEDKFTAPEILNGKKFDEKVDVYSFGILVFYLLCGKKPKISTSSVSNGKHADIPDSLNDFASSLIKKCWSFNAKKRPSFSEICEEISENNYQLFDLSKLEYKEAEVFIEKYKKHIPNYSD